MYVTGNDSTQMKICCCCYERNFHYFRFDISVTFYNSYTTKFVGINKYRDVYNSFKRNKQKKIINCV